MIINIAGTSGSGKSHLIRAFMTWAKEQGGKINPLTEELRKLPSGYDVTFKKRKPIHIIGPYEKADTAGCDVLRNIEVAYSYIHDAYDAGKDVIFEGLFMMNMTRGPQMVEKYDHMYIIHFTDPLATCIASINSRREARGEGPLLKKENTVGNFKRANNYADRMAAAGASVIKTKRDKALGLLVGTLGFDIKHDRIGNHGI